MNTATNNSEFSVDTDVTATFLKDSSNAHKPDPKTIGMSIFEHLEYANQYKGAYDTFHSIGTNISEYAKLNDGSVKERCFTLSCQQMVKQLSAETTGKILVSSEFSEDLTSDGTMYAGKFETFADIFKINASVILNKLLNLNVSTESLELLAFINSEHFEIYHGGHMPCGLEIVSFSVCTPERKLEIRSKPDYDAGRTYYSVYDLSKYTNDQKEPELIIEADFTMNEVYDFLELNNSINK
ncbi:MAG: hypothetical protein ACI89T_001860 [Cognaticolwellia sp.]|jgi:hypothetical protein